MHRLISNSRRSFSSCCRISCWGPSLVQLLHAQPLAACSLLQALSSACMAEAELCNTQ
jgi:hypothetical protein